ncbi:DUF7519 family protein [Halosimplex halophilum]|uniref:DUF7519 family protein n=1 Tax=Halosimplex halophilum TaxID=2559572 RepID=UPI00107FD2A3|nr:hypothetical protein [Halosimplex halophilum]
MTAGGAAGDRGDAGAVDPTPSRASAGLAVAMTALSVAVVPGTVGTVVGVPGAVLVAGGAIRGSRQAVDYGAVAVISGAVLAGLGGTAPLPVALGALLAVLAWDAGRYGIALGEQLGREAATTRVAVTHSALTAAIGVGGVGLGYGAYLVAAPGDSTVALLALLVGVAAVVPALR